MGVNVIQLTSKNYHENILVSLHQMWQQGHLSDVTVKVDYQGDVQEFQAHQVMLAASSGYFKKILLSQDATRDKLLLSNMHFKQFSKFLEFVYTGKVEVARDKIEDVLAAAQCLDCEDLAVVCGEAMNAGILQNPTRKTSAAEVVDKDDLHGAKTDKGTKRKRPPKSSLSAQSPEKEARVKRCKVKNTVTHEKRQVRKLKLALVGRKFLHRRLTTNEENQVSNEDAEECEERSEAEVQPGKGEQSLVGMPAYDEDDWECQEDEQSCDPEDTLFSPVEEEEEEEKSREKLKRTSKAQFQCNKCQRTFHYERSYLKHIR